MVMMMMKIFLQFLLSSTQLTAASRRLAGEKTAVLGRTKNFERCNQMMWVWHLRKMSLMQQCCVPNREKITSLCLFFIVFTHNNFDCTQNLVVLTLQHYHEKGPQKRDFDMTKKCDIFAQLLRAASLWSHWKEKSQFRPATQGRRWPLKACWQPPINDCPEVTTTTTSVF